jgi:hypothetical protein
MTPKTLPVTQNRARPAEFETKVESQMDWYSGRSLAGAPVPNSFAPQNLAQTQFCRTRVKKRSTGVEL